MAEKMCKHDLVSIKGMYEILDVHNDEVGGKKYLIKIGKNPVYFTEDMLVKAPEPKDLMGGRVGDAREMRTND